MFENLRARLTGAGFDTVQNIKDMLSADNKRASGALIDKTRFEIQDTGSLLTLLLKAPAHWRFVDEGRRPGAKQPPTDKIARWMRQRGISGSPFVIARAIGRRGIEATNIYSDAVMKLIEDARINEFALQDINEAALEALQPNK